MRTGRDRARRVLFIVENLPVPFDRRVWQEATTLHRQGYGVSVICPKASGYERSHEVIDGIAIYRHPLPFEATGWLGYLLEYAVALFFQFVLAWRVFFTRGFDAIHACNPPDTIFIVGGFFKLFFGKRFIFDHHDLSPELYQAKTGKQRGTLHRVLLLLERLTFRVADVSIATNDSYRAVAVGRGGMDPADVFVVRSGPDMSRVQRRAPNVDLRRGHRYLVTYVGIMGPQDGVPLLIEAARYLVRDLRCDAQFVLVGGGTEFDRVRDLVAEYGLEDCVTLTGLQPPHSDVFLDALNTADVGVAPDPPNPMNDKSTMNKTLEYMAFGKPVVQFELTEGRASAGPAALYARGEDAHDLAHKIETLLEHQDMREAMGRLGRERIETTLSWQHQEPALLNAYDRAFVRRARSGAVRRAGTAR